MNSDNVQSNDQTGVTPQAAFTFVQFQVDQITSTNPQTQPRHEPGGKGGLTFIQYQPPQPTLSTETTAHGVNFAQSIVNPVTTLSRSCHVNTGVSDNPVDDTGREGITHPFASRATPPLVETHTPRNPEPAAEDERMASPAVLSPAPTESPSSRPAANISGAGVSAGAIPATNDPPLTGKSTAAMETPTDTSAATTETLADAVSATQETLEELTDTTVAAVPTTNSPGAPTPATTSTAAPTETTTQSTQEGGLDKATPAVDTPYTPRTGPATEERFSNTNRSHENDEDSSDNDIRDEHSTHQLRNPNRPVIPSGSRPKHMKGNSYTTNVAKEIRHTKDKLFDADIEALLGKLAADMKVVAKTHSRSEDCIKQLVIQRSNYKSKRKPNIFNALVHRTAVEVNGDRPWGNRVPLQEIQQIALKTQRELTEEEEEELVKELNAHRDTMTNGVRCNNGAANQDFQSTVTRIGSELTALNNRTNCVAIAFFVPGHINDTTFPSWVHSGDADQFITDELKMSCGELSRRFELWATSRKTKKKTLSKLVALQKECAGLLVEGLRNITGRRDLKMNYEKYEREVKLAHKVKLRKWPTGFPLQSPYKITRMSDVVLLHDAIKTGECHWEEMSSQEYEDLKRELKGKDPKPRNKGKGKRKRSADDENVDPNVQPPARKKARKGRKAAVAQPTSGSRSRSVITSDDEID